ncbi:hypothetical protein M9H77_07812 [Catharanthus roseus]|uniref:Uncharacterized protein n=1 Tax=Catharanthus roseus TaxID=4058 RepID=A0ACC0BW82_CATRO|nr:hypothetical protein M9H77_07812 [Catharanthus roseus]
MVKEGIKSIKPTLELPYLKDNTITNNPSCDPSPSSIPVEVETISEPTLEPPQELETNSKPSACSSSSPVPEASDLILDGSDQEEEHPEAQTQALRDYQLARDRVCRVSKDHPQLVAKGFSQIEGIDFNEIFSLVVKYKTILIILALVAFYAQLSSPLPNDAWASTCRIGCLGFFLGLPFGPPLDRVTQDARSLGWPPGLSAGDSRDRSAFSSY